MKPFDSYLGMAVAGALSAALLAGCGGGGGASSVPSTPSGGKTSQVKMTLHFNNITGTSIRGRKYVSRSTQGIGVTFVATPTVPGSSLPSTETAMQSPTYATPVSSGYVGTNTTCTTADVTGAFTCSLLFAAPVGYDDFQITTWDQSPAASGYGGTFNASANNLTVNNVLNQLILLDETNAFNLALNGVVNSVYLSAAPGEVLAGAAPSTITLNVFAKDADGNVIIGNGNYVDVNGSPLTITVNAPSVTLPGSPVGTGGTLAYALGAPTTFTGPSVQSTSISYNGGDILSGQVTGSTAATSVPVFTANVSFTESTGTVNIGGSPTLSPFNILSGFGGGLTSAFGSLWASGSSGVQQFNTSGVATAPAAVGNLGAISAGPDGYLWAADNWGPNVYRIDPSTLAFATYAEPAAAEQSHVMILGPDGNLWYSVQQADGLGNYDVERITPAKSGANPPTVTNCPLNSSSGGAFGLATDGTLIWIGDIGGAIESYDLACTTDTQYTLTTGVGQVNAIVVDSTSSRNLWIGGNTGIAEMSRTGTEIAHWNGSTATTVPGAAIGGVLGPDGNVWFTEQGAENAIIRINPDNGALQKYTSGVTAPYHITAGPDQNIWFQDGNNAVQLALP